MRGIQFKPCRIEKLKYENIGCLTNLLSDKKIFIDTVKGRATCKYRYPFSNLEMLLCSKNKYIIFYLAKALNRGSFG